MLKEMLKITKKHYIKSIIMIEKFQTRPILSIRIRSIG